MQTILVLLVTTFVLGAAQIVSLEGFYDSLLDWPVQKRDEPEYICHDGTVDIALVIDSSRSIDKLDFKVQIDFLVEFVTLFDIRPTKVRFAAVSFGQRVITQGAFNFNKYNSTAEVQWGLRRIKYEGVKYGGETNTASALKYTRDRYFPRARPGAKKVCIVLTDGRSTDPRKTQEEAALIRRENVTMVAIGIGKHTSMEELKGIASSADYVFTVDKHSLLETIQKKLIQKTCTDLEVITKEPPFQNDKIPITTEPTTQQNEEPTSENYKACKGSLDINFIFNPTQIGTRRIITFIQNTVTSKALENDDVRVGVITVPFQDINGFRLNRYQTKKKIKTHFEQYKTNLLSPQLHDLRVEAFLPINGGRTDARRIGVVFLRGKLDDVYKSIDEAKLAKKAGIEIYAIDLGDSNVEVVLDTIASGRSHVIHASNTHDFLAFSEEFMEIICKM